MWLLVLLGRLGRLFSRNRGRDVFRFYDGRRWREIDPFIPARVLFSHPKFDWDETLVLLTMPRVKPQLETAAVIVQAVQDAFKVKPFDQGGLTELEAIDLLYDFRDYLGNVKKNGSLFPTSQPAMGGTPSQATSQIENNTKPVLDAGSTVTDNCSVPHGQPVPEPSQGPTETPNQCVSPSQTPMIAVA